MQGINDTDNHCALLLLQRLAHRCTVEEVMNIWVPFRPAFAPVSVLHGKGQTKPPPGATRAPPPIRDFDH